MSSVCNRPAVLPGSRASNAPDHRGRGKLNDLKRSPANPLAELPADSRMVVAIVRSSTDILFLSRVVRGSGLPASLIPRALLPVHHAKRLPAERAPRRR